MNYLISLLILFKSNEMYVIRCVTRLHTYSGQEWAENMSNKNILKLRSVCIGTTTLCPISFRWSSSDRSSHWNWEMQTDGCPLPCCLSNPLDNQSLESYQGFHNSTKWQNSRACRKSESIRLINSELYKELLDIQWVNAVFDFILHFNGLLGGRHCSGVLHRNERQLRYLCHKILITSIQGKI